MCAGFGGPARFQRVEAGSAAAPYPATSPDLLVCEQKGRAGTYCDKNTGIQWEFVAGALRELEGEVSDYTSEHGYAAYQGSDSRHATTFSPFKAI